MTKKKVYAYFDGSNFYHALKSNYNIIRIDYQQLTSQLLKQSENLVKMKYFNAPVNQQENPKGYASQQRFFSGLRKTPQLELYLGKLKKRYLNKINVLCPKCGHQKGELIQCPICDYSINLNSCSKHTEKGVDVKLAISMLLDGINDEYDIALLFSNDADFSPAIEYITSKLNKTVIYCRFPNIGTSQLVSTCSETRMVSEAIVKKASGI